MSAASARPRAFNNRDPDRFGFALLIGVAVHAMILFGIGFSAPQKPPAPASLAVTIAVDDSRTAPDKADFLAQSNQSGSGEHSEAEELSTDREADFSGERITPAQPATPPLPPDSGTEQAAERPLPVITEAVSASPTPPATQVPGEPVPMAEPFTPSAEVASLRAKLDRLRRDYSRRPRVLRLTSVNTMAAEAAPYLDYWETLVEQVGNQHYPEEARRRRVFGNLRLAVRLRPDGSVEQVEILASSGHRVLDLAAIQTIRLAAPFAPFPPELARWDRLEIIRTWRFTPGDRLQTAAAPP